MGGHAFAGPSMLNLAKVPSDPRDAAFSVPMNQGFIFARKRRIIRRQAIFSCLRDIAESPCPLM
jgi:hypothetical protein